MTKVSAMGLVLVLILSFMPQTAVAVGTGAGITFQPAPAYKVTYDNDDGVKSYEMHDAGSLVKVDGSLKKAEHSFSGWKYGGPSTVNSKGASVDNGTVIAPDTTFIMPLGDVTLTALWTRMYAVTFHRNDSRVDSTYAVVFVPSGGQIGESNIPPDPSRLNYRFVGWNLDRYGGTDKTSSIAGMPINEDITVYAQWRASGGTSVLAPTPVPTPTPTPTPTPEPEPTPPPEPEPTPPPPEPELEQEPETKQEPEPTSVPPPAGATNPQQPSNPPSNPSQSAGSRRPASTPGPRRSPAFPLVMGFEYGNEPFEATGYGQGPGQEPGEPGHGLDAGAGSDSDYDSVTTPNPVTYGGSYDADETGITAFDSDTMQYEDIGAPEQEIEEEYTDFSSWDVPLLDFGNFIIPLYAPKGINYCWALLNLILGSVGVIIAAMFILRTLLRKLCAKREAQVRYFEEAKDDSGRPVEGKAEKWFRLALLAVVTIMGALGIIIFILTQDTRNIMVLIDRLTVTHVIILAIEIIAVMLSKKKKAYNEYRAGTESRLPA